MRTSLRILGALATIGGLLVAGSSASAVADPVSPPVSPTVTTAGFDFPTWSAADLVSGRSDNSILVNYTAGQEFTDGTLRVDLPRVDWPTRLHPVDEINSVATYRGAVVVRPSLDTPLPAAGPGWCTWPQTTPRIERSADSQDVVVPGVSCEAGQSLEIRLGNVRALAAGTHYVSVTVSTDTWGTGDWVPVEVVAPPTITLQITTPPGIPFQTTFPVRVTARRSDGSVATDYTGAVALVTKPRDCSAHPEPDAIAHQFTPADGGVADIPMWLGTDIARMIQVRDIAHRALSGTSKALVNLPITDPQPHVVCPVSYH